MMRTLNIRPLTPTAFAPFGDILSARGTPDKLINEGMCGRFHDRATLDFGDGRAGISIFDAKPRSLPLELAMVERHPDGSQAFIPMHSNHWLAVVAPDQDGTPGDPLVFRVQPGEAVNFHRGTWHGVLCPLADPGLFAVIDRIGDGANLEEHWFDTPYTIFEDD